MSLGLLISSAIVILVLSSLITWLITHLINQKKLEDHNRQISQLETTLEMERANFKDKLNDRNAISNIFSDLSQRALETNNDHFLKLAQEKLSQFQIMAGNDLDKRSNAIDNMIKPIKEALDKTEKQIHLIEKERKESFGALNQHLESLARAHESLQGETRNLVTALRRPEVRGKWGELTLKRVVELAGMVEHCDFYEQEQTKTETGSLRPDMIVRLPGEREIVIDVKTPLDAYLNAIESKDETERQSELLRHCRSVRARAKELSSKNYWSQFEKAPDFVVMFIPGEQFLSAALELDHEILENALQQKVIIATPTTLVALLRAVAYGWRQQTLEKNATQIKILGEEMYKRLGVFTDHLARLGKSLGSSLDHYNKAIGSLERQLIPSARKMEELGINSEESIEVPNPIEQTTRELNSPTSHPND